MASLSWPYCYHLRPSTLYTSGKISGIAIRLKLRVFSAASTNGITTRAIIHIVKKVSTESADMERGSPRFLQRFLSLGANTQVIP